MNIPKYQHLIGKDRSLVSEALGQELNYYHSDVWVYTLGKDWIYRKIILLIFFKNNKVTEIKIKKRYGKYNP